MKQDEIIKRVREYGVNKFAALTGIPFSTVRAKIYGYRRLTERDQAIWSAYLLSNSIGGKTIVQCAYCTAIQNDDGSWSAPVTMRIDDASHGICSHCLEIEKSRIGR